eukprot:CAMPEP_0181347606 /NCGR_PEP_ID=MMETSP1101-20121128/33968_1 /TAXON_ID=46948 /ORGANISM="Rhodomonas abbreviata, Strain Caron Lab Isolate" /LENGTH=185 /DNA_ID=CAMNT_0023459831 /DNA_START=81 /DNA_END=634 /DNA_ORIENTATION=+
MDALLKGKSLLLSGNHPTPMPRTGIVGLYFSAQWCPVSREFTAVLAESYENLRKDGEKFQIVLVSSDRSEAEFLQHFDEHPWLAVPYGERKLIASLKKRFAVTTVPTLVLLNAATGEEITKDGAAFISNYKDGALFPWSDDISESESVEYPPSTDCCLPLKKGCFLAVLWCVFGSMKKKNKRYLP